MAGGAFRLRGEGQRELVHVADETWIAAPPARVGQAVADPAVWEAFWPGLAPRLVEARGVEGVRLAVEEPPGERHHGWHGTAELYVHPEFEGVLLFQFLRLDPAPGRRVPAREVRREQARRSATGLAASWALKDRLEERKV
ncbi:polyketide cyclase / dehydrase and lipid transport [Jatrophihabitans sp. YIM 134969]